MEGVIHWELRAIDPGDLRENKSLYQSRIVIVSITTD